MQYSLPKTPPAQALVSGTQAQELGKALNYPEPGFLFTNAILSSLGELILALCRREVAEHLEMLRLEDPTNYGETIIWACYLILLRNKIGVIVGGISGEPRAARTHDPRLKRAMLYQLS
jgi:hypothetical protein